MPHTRSYFPKWMKTLLYFTFGGFLLQDGRHHFVNGQNSYTGAQQALMDQNNPAKLPVFDSITRQENSFISLQGPPFMEALEDRYEYQMFSDALVQDLEYLDKPSVYITYNTKMFVNLPKEKRDESIRLKIPEHPDLTIEYQPAEYNEEGECFVELIIRSKDPVAPISSESVREVLANITFVINGLSHIFDPFPGKDLLLPTLYINTEIGIYSGERLVEGKSLNCIAPYCNECAIEQTVDPEKEEVVTDERQIPNGCIEEVKRRVETDETDYFDSKTAYGMLALTSVVPLLISSFGLFCITQRYMQAADAERDQQVNQPTS